MLRQLTLIALAGYTTGLALGTGICFILWARNSGERCYRLKGR